MNSPIPFSAVSWEAVAVLILISPELLFFAVPEAADKEAVLMSEEDSGADSTSLMEMVETAPLEVNLMTTVTTIAAISPKRITFRAISEADSFFIAVPFRWIP